LCSYKSAYAQDIEDNNIYKITEIMPIARACQNIKNKTLKELCNDCEREKFIYGHSAYYDIESEINGNHIVNLFIEKDGSISEFFHLRSVSNKVTYKLDEIMQELSDSNFFSPAIHKGKKVRFCYMLPIRVYDEHPGEIIPEKTKGIYESDEDFVASLGVPLKVNGKNYSKSRIEELEKKCATEYSIKNWLYNESEDVSINIKCSK
jgi:ribosomal protein S27E